MAVMTWQRWRGRMMMEWTHGDDMSLTWLTCAAEVDINGLMMWQLMWQICWIGSDVPLR